MISEALWVWKVLEHLLHTFNMMHCSNLLDKYTEVELLGHKVVLGFPGSSAGKETACSAGDSSLIPGLGSSPGEGIGYRLQYSWASLVDQTVKNLCVMQETWVWSLGWEDPLQEDMATHSGFLAWRIPRTEEPGGLQPTGLQRVRHSQAWHKVIPRLIFWGSSTLFSIELTPTWIPNDSVPGFQFLHI